MNTATVAPNILIVTVTKVETQAVVNAFCGPDIVDWPRKFVNDNLYYNMGIQHETQVYLVQSEMGAVTVGGSFSTVKQAIDDLKPKAVIMCGIAFGTQPLKQKLGDILIADQLVLYEPQKVDQLKGPIPRGERVASSPRLLKWFRSGANDWKGEARTDFGLIFSGEKLINDQAFLNELLGQEPEGIGGEMEGAGLYAAAREANVDWILVKAICDWADGSKNKEAQPMAAENAAKFVFHTLQRAGLSSGKPKLFINHAPEDEKLAKGFVELIEQSFTDCQPELIFCTNVEGQKQLTKDLSADRLASELQPLVIVNLTTPNHKELPWTLSVLKAAWSGLKNIVMVHNGLSQEQIKAQFDDYPLKHAGDEDDISAVIEIIEKDLSWKPNSRARVYNAIKKFTTLAARLEKKPERLLFRSEIVKELPWEDVLAQTSVELYVWGWSGLNVIDRRTRNTFEDLLGEKKKTIKFLISNPVAVIEASKVISFAPVCSHRLEPVNDDIRDGRVALIKFKTDLAPQQRDRFIIKETNWFMAWSGLAIDPALETGLLQVENYLYDYAREVPGKKHLDYRPNILLTRQSKFYIPYWTSIEKMWNAADIIAVG